MTQLNINKIGIIGGGPGGLAALYEFLHTNADGTSAVGEKALENPRFDVQLFEQKLAAGGIWSPGVDKADQLPESLKEDFNQPDSIHGHEEVPEGVESATYDSPIVVASEKTDRLWKNSGVFPGLFTNIPARFTRYLYLPVEEEYDDKTRIIYPFLTQEEQLERLERFVENEKLNNHIRYNSSVVNAYKKDGKWNLVIHDKSDDNSKWYTEQFDAIVVANGHYTIPNIPNIPGLREFHNSNPGVVIHSKLYRSPNEFKDKRVLVIGGSILTVNQLQYIVPVAKETVSAVRSKHIVFEWINGALVLDGITSKPAVDRIEADGTVVFADGTTADKFDKIVLTTGYHYHYPFVDKNILQVESPLNVSRVAGLYYDTFSIEDPTVGVVGVAVSTLNFHTIEASAAALAGVWSGATQLPLKEVQKKREQDWIDATGDNLLFHYYRHYDVKPEFIDKLRDFAAPSRPYVLREDGYHLPIVAKAFKYQEKLFYGLKDGSITIEDTSEGTLKKLDKPVTII